MVTLEIAGPTDSQAAAAFHKAFAANGLSAKVQESKRAASRCKLMGQIDKSTDLQPVEQGRRVGRADQEGQLPPAVELVIYAPLTKENSQQAIAQLEKIKGVDAKHSTADIKKGALRVRISGTDKVTAEDISKAVQTAGVPAANTRRRRKEKRRL